MLTKNAKPTMFRLLQAGILLGFVTMAGCKSDEIIQSYYPNEKMLIEEAKMSYKDQFESMNGFDRYFSNPLWKNYTLTEDSLFNSLVIPFKPINEKIHAYFMYSVPKDNKNERVSLIRVFNYEKAISRKKSVSESSDIQLVDLPNNRVLKGYINEYRWFTKEKIKQETIIHKLATRKMASDEDIIVWHLTLNEIVVIGKKRGNGGNPFTPPSLNFPDPGIPQLPNRPDPYDPGYPDPEHGGSSSSSAPSAPLPVVNKDEESFKDFPEAKEVFDCIVGEGTGKASELVKTFLSRYIGNSAPFNVTFKVGTISSSSTTALCDFTKDYKNGEILLNKDRMGRSSIEIARTLIHETMHAYMHAYLYSKDSSDLKYGITNFDEAFDAFQANIQKEKGNPSIDPDSQHKYMAENWIELLATELQKLHKTQNNYNIFWAEMKERGVEINEQNKKIYYEALAWQGLDKTNAYISMKDEKKNSLKTFLNAAYRLAPLNWTCKP